MSREPIYPAGGGNQVHFGFGNSAELAAKTVSPEIPDATLGRLLRSEQSKAVSVEALARSGYFVYDRTLHPFSPFPSYEKLKSRRLSMAGGYENIGLTWDGAKSFSNIIDLVHPDDRDSVASAFSEERYRQFVMQCIPETVRHEVARLYDEVTRPEPPPAGRDWLQARLKEASETPYERRLLDLIGSAPFTERTMVQELEFRMARPGENGQERWFSLKETAVILENGRVMINGMMHDVTEERALRLLKAEHDAQLKRRANIDELTGLMKKQAFIDAVQTLYDTGKTDGVWLLLLDLNRFKPVNDFVSYEAGDKALKSIAGRITRALRTDRERDGAILPADFASKYGGDELTIVMHDIQTKAEMMAVVDRLAHEIFGNSIVIDVPQNGIKPEYLDRLPPYIRLMHRDDGHDGYHLSIDTGAAIGVVPLVESSDAVTAIGRADDVMYQAKRRCHEVMDGQSNGVPTRFVVA